MKKKVESSTERENLPSYKNPPVNEVVCGMRFQNPPNLRIPHLGLLWDKFRANYPNIQHAQPISSTKGEILIDTITGIPLPRVWFINESDDQLIQFQFDRFYFNWRRREKDYPRYSHVIKNFEVLLCTIENFFEESGLGNLKPIEYELSYINHIPKGQGWKNIDDISEIFTDFIWQKSSSRFLKYPDKINWNAEFILPVQNGTMGVTLKQAIKTEDKTPLFVLELKAKGISKSQSNKSIREWFDLAHEWIVRGFTDLTTTNVQKVWGKEDNA